MDLNRSISEGGRTDGIEEKEDDSTPSVLISDIAKREKEVGNRRRDRRRENRRGEERRGCPFTVES